jgi:hypothetical protein
MSSAPGTANEVPADDRDESDTITACAVTLIFLASVAVGLRFYVRVSLLGSVKSEDWCMLASLVSETPPASLLRRGFGISRSTCVSRSLQSALPSSSYWVSTRTSCFTPTTRNADVGL